MVTVVELKRVVTVLKLYRQDDPFIAGADLCEENTAFAVNLGSCLIFCQSRAHMDKDEGDSLLHQTLYHFVAVNAK